jgi:hypothetical protein
MAVLTRIGAVRYRQTVPKDVTYTDLAAYADLDVLIQLWAILREHVSEPDAQGNVRIALDVPGVSDLIAGLDRLVPAKVSANRRPPVQLVVLVLIWLILIGGPVAEGKLPNEIQMMLSTEVGTVSLALAITQMMNQKRK